MKKFVFGIFICYNFFTRVEGFFFVKVKVKFEGVEFVELSVIVLVYEVIVCFFRRVVMWFVLYISFENSCIICGELGVFVFIVLR